MEKTREIKFRAWDGKQMLHVPAPTVYALERFFGFITDVTPLMQYTGLKDKNGKEIYEGDIVKLTNKVGGLGQFPYDGEAKYRIVSVFWSDFRASWSCKFNDHANNDLFKYCQNGETCEVIGNIYENPELLK